MIPPLTELRLLRELQKDLATRTRAASEADNARARDGAGDVQALGDEQDHLRELGEAVIKRIEKEQQRGPQVQPPGGPS